MKFGRNHKFLVIAAAVLCLLAAFFSVKHLRAGASSRTRIAGDVMSAAVAVAKRAPIGNTFSVAGEFLPYQEIEVHAKVAGYIRRINVDIGDRVKTGQVLAVLEVPELVAELQGTEAGVRHSQQEIERAQNEVARDQAQFVALHANAARLAQASKARPGLVAQQELDDAEAKDRAAEAEVESAKSALSAARQQLEVSQANNSQISAMSDYTRITAPFEGVVTWRYADTGALVQAGTSNSNSAPVVKLAQVNVLRLRIPVPESLAGSVRVGEPADVTVQATGGHFVGHVTRFTDALDRTTRTMQVEIDVANDTYKLQPGMYANVALQVQNHSDALTVPTNAIQRSHDTTTVLLVDPQNRVQQREVRIGIDDGNNVEILSGLSPGDRLIIGNLVSYQPGQLVRPKESAQMTVNGATE